MSLFYEGLFFIAGTIAGSFLNVCIYRIPRGKSILSPSSHCPACGHKIRPIDNIPLLSYILLKGKCRSCKKKISLRYPLVELITGLLWVQLYNHFGLTFQLIPGLFFVTLLVVLAAIDYDTNLIPNKIMLPAIAISFIFTVLYVLKIKSVPIIANAGVGWSVAGFFIGGGLLYLIAIIASAVFRKDAMGGGDIKLAAFAGLYLGGYILLALFIGFFLGAIVGIILIAKDKSKSMSKTMPFGPFIAAGSIITLFFGLQLWSKYLALAGLS